MQLRIAYLFDPESQNWSFRVPSLGIIGGADTREEAEQAVIEAITYALEEEDEGVEPVEGEVQYLDLAVRR
jgi:predicted RNase H-like HicB family nuclease